MREGIIRLVEDRAEKFEKRDERDTATALRAIASDIRAELDIVDADTSESER